MPPYQALDFLMDRRILRLMNVPRYWEKATGEVEAPDGTHLGLIAWGWSHLDRHEARQTAAQRLRRMIARVTAGELLGKKYPYGNALREEIVEEIVDGDDRQLALITRNSYGALVLNAPDFMFIDVDLPPEPGGHWLRRLFGRKATTTADEHALKLQEALAKASDATFRLYRTAAGFRVLATSRKFEPGSAEAERVMTSAGADPSYVQLCRAQRSFRARLTPKPFRLGYAMPPNSYPRTSEEEQAFRKWLSTYEEKSKATSVCRYLSQVGNRHTDPAIAPLLRLHDEVTRAQTDLPLA